MKVKINKKYLFILGIIAALCFFLPACAQTDINSDSQDPITGTVPVVSVQVVDTYCEGGAGYARVYFGSEPDDGAVFQVSGEYASGGSAVYTFHTGEHKLPAGIYIWSALSISRVTDRIDSSSGKFAIDIKCGTTSDTEDGLTGTTETEEVPADSSTITLAIPEPPAIFDVLSQNNTTFMLFDWSNCSYCNVSHFVLYRRSIISDWNWKVVSKIPLSECAGYACSYKVIEDNLGDGGEYAISTINSLGIESVKTPAKSPLTEDGDSVLISTPADESISVVSDTYDNTEQWIDPSLDDLVADGISIIRSVLIGTHVLFLETQYADLVEWYIKRDPGEISEYLGTAVFNKKSLRWEYIWDTTRVPNGNYVLIPKISSILGKEYKDTPSYVTVKNKDTNNASMATNTSLADQARKALLQVTLADEANKEDELRAKENIIDIITPYNDKVRKYINSDQNTTLKKEELKEEFTKEQERSKKYLRRLIDIESSKFLEGALSGDEEKKERIREKIILAFNNSLEKTNEIARKFGIEFSDEELELIRKEMRIKMSEFEKIIERKKEILRGRVGQDVFKDSDKDGISNYDEINIYGTDPLNADSDNDGYVDGAEIMGGFDPKNTSVEAVIQYEEPLTAGYTEEEIFSVDSISVKEIEIDEKGKERAKKILFEGKAPANSFVTLYIYSTPIIVTVKTDENGSWNYVLDKELEDGSHKIYVAITDNAGKIFAKSRPLPFVKEAAAVTIDEGLLLGNSETNHSIFNRKYLYPTILLIIIIIGWVLIRTGSSQNRPEQVGTSRKK